MDGISLEGFTLDVYMYQHGYDYWDGRFDEGEDARDFPNDPEGMKRRRLEAMNRREFTRTLKGRLARLAAKHQLTTPGENDTSKVGSAVRSWLADEHGKGDEDAGRMPVATIVALLCEVPAKDNGKPPAAVLTTGETLKRDLELAGAVMDTNAAKIFQIARGGGSAESKMFAIVEIDATYWGRNSREWAELLDVSDSAIKKTDFWRIDRPNYFADTKALWRERHPDEELPDELKKYDRESQD